ncbi:hypothetical protein BGZ83_001141 [Gryganskiella cystojenkinii]|nr:hypothetical protein BGZ83_001141 [Gryganskiella cystojenkinii]
MQQNVSLALNALVQHGISLEGTRGGVVTPRDIVEGHREKTFGLLWKLILNWKVSVLLDLSVLESEIFALKREFKRLYGRPQPDRVDTVYFTSDQLSALLRWCQAIGAFYNISINNFTTSFSDGRGFGALLSYYHPTLLDMGEMKDSAKYLEEYKQGKHQSELQPPTDNDGKGWFIDARDITDPVTQAKEMDRFNYRLLHSKVQALGGVPISLRHADMSNVGVPDEKAVILFVTYLCARLMHLNKDIRASSSPSDHVAAKTIQRIWRKKHYGRKEESRIKATLVLQKHIRRWISGKRLRDSTKKRNEAALLIQTGCRMYLAQIRAIHKMETAIMIQNQCRAFLARKWFVELQWAALTVQRVYRGHVARVQYTRALEVHRGVQAIQAQARGYLARKQYLLLRIAADVVQTRRRALVEGRRIRETYLEIQKATVVIQRQWRATVTARRVRAEFLEKRDWATMIQAQVRSKLVRLAFLEQIWAATVIQRRIREWRLARDQREDYLKLRWAATVIQARWRAVVAQRQVQRQYQLYQWAAVKIQSFVRMHLVRKNYLELREAALVVQHRRRALVECRQQEQYYQQLRAATFVIQERWRALLLGREVRRQYQEHRSLTIRLQAAIRGHLLRQRLIKEIREAQASQMIQACWRGYVQRQNFLRQKAAAIRIQQAWRAVQLQRQQHHNYQLIQWATIVTQRWWRAQVEGRRVQNEYLRLKQATITIQSAYRGLMARRRVLMMRTIVGIQASVRARYARWQFERMRAAAIVIQRQWRARQQGHQQRIAYETTVQASLIIQRQWRAILEGRKVREEYLIKRAVVIATQSHVRGMNVRKLYQELRWAAITIQQRWLARILGRQQRQRYEAQWMAARTIQTTWRSVRLTRLHRHAYLDLRWASMVIQRRWREILETRALNQELKAQREAAAVMIQAAVRGALVRNRVREFIESRERLIGKWIDLTTYSMSAIVIQRAWRQHRERQLFELHTSAATMIQRWWRQRQEDRQVHQLEVLTLMMQTQIRGLLARRRFERQQQAVLYIQSFWRGHVVRKECTAKIKAARKRIEHANATAEEHMKLGNRTTMALDILLSSGQLSAVLKACYHLDVVTRLSKNSCQRLVEHNVINIIFQLIKSCNRSQPHMEVLKHGLNIIENLSRDLDTNAAVFYAPEGMEILVECSQAYRENEMVFESVVTILLLHLEVDPARRKVVRGMTTEIKKLKGVLTVMERKVERETRTVGGGSRFGSGSAMASGPAAVAKANSVRMLVSSVTKLRKIVDLVK